MIHFFFSITVILFTICNGQTVPEDFGLNVMELIQKYGYPVELFESVVTPDGYLIDIHRIPHGKNKANETDKPVVLLAHGALSSAADWVNTGPEKGLGFILADLGYDVWMLNARGTTWSRKHLILDPYVDRREYWNFSWHEIAVYDLPTVIDLMLETTKQEKIFYIGHSQGTTIFFVLASEIPEYNQKIQLMIAFAPVAYMFHLYSPGTREMLPYYDEIVEFTETHEIFVYLPWSPLLEQLGLALCSDGKETQQYCVDYLNDMAGPNEKQLNKTLLPVFLSNAPAGTSVKQQMHYGQVIMSGGFHKFDYGEQGNFEKYGQPTPPEYDLSKITAPVALYYSYNDWMVDIWDVRQLAHDLPNVIQMHLNEDPEFNHVNYIWAIDINELLYNNVTDLMNAQLNS